MDGVLMEDTYPNASNILARIAEIQEIIVTTSKATQTPGASVDNLPFWLTVIRAVTPRPDAHVSRQSMWDFEVAMVLFRERAEMARTNLASMQQISGDMVTTLKEFGLRHNLETPTYPTIPAQFISDSVSIRCEGYVEEDIGNSGIQLAGSAYVLEFGYEVYQSIAAIEGIKT